MKDTFVEQGLTAEIFEEILNAPVWGVREEVWNPNEGGYWQNFYKVCPNYDDLRKGVLEQETGYLITWGCSLESPLTRAIQFYSDKDKRCGQILARLKKQPVGQPIKVVAAA